MALTLQLTAGSVPGGTEFPGTVQGLLNLIAQYEAITGGSGYITINFGSTTPTAPNRAFPWFKTDSGGVPIGWFSWNGSAWQQMPTQIATGNTASRPAGVAGLLYFDTDIYAMLVYERSAWRTLDGTPGEVKMVRSCYAAGSAITDPTIGQVLTANPGWTEFTPMAGRVPMGVGTGSGLTARTLAEEVGDEAVVLDVTELPAHTHTVAGSARIQADGNVSNPAGIIASYSSTTSGSAGSDAAHENMQPSFGIFFIIKS